MFGKQPLSVMDTSRCVVIEFDVPVQDVLLKYLSKNEDNYNWILTAFCEIRVCVWWKKNVEFSTTPLRSFLKRLKSKIPINSYLRISRKMSSKEGVQKVYNGNRGDILTREVLQSSIHRLERSVREVIIGMQLLNNTPGSLEIKEPDNEEPNNEQEPSNEEAITKAGDPPSVEPCDKDREFRLNISTKLDLLLKITARIATQVKKLSQPVQPEVEVVEVMDDSHADESTTPPKPPKFNLTSLYCNRDPITGKCDGDPRGHFHPF